MATKRIVTSIETEDESRQSKIIYERAAEAGYVLDDDVLGIIDEVLAEAASHLPLERMKEIGRDIVDEAIHGDGHCIEVSREDLFTLSDQIVSRLAASTFPSENPTREELDLLWTVFNGGLIDTKRLFHLRDERILASAPDKESR